MGVCLALSLRVDPALEDSTPADPILVGVSLVMSPRVHLVYPNLAPPTTGKVVTGKVGGARVLTCTYLIVVISAMEQAMRLKQAPFYSF